MAGLRKNLWSAQTSLSFRVNSFRDLSYGPICKCSRQNEPAPFTTTRHHPHSSLRPRAVHELAKCSSKANIALLSIGCDRKNTERFFTRNQRTEEWRRKKRKRIGFNP
eukprot:2765957-Rhodomonas_salina.2